MKGYIKIHRGLLLHPALQKKNKSLCEIGAFVWLLLEASFLPRKYRIQNAEIDLKRGQLCCSVSYMAQAWNWDKSKVQRYLARLKHFDTITSDTPNDTSSNNKQNKLQKNDKIYNDEFNALWGRLRAKKGSKKKAQDKYLKIRSTVKVDDLVEKYNKLCDETKDFTYIPHFITWLNGERYLDEDKIEKPKQISIDQHFREMHRNVVPKGFCFVGNSWNEVEYTDGKERLTFNIRSGDKI